VDRRRLYDKKFVAERTVGFEVWERYVTGADDGIPKTPIGSRPRPAFPRAKCVRSRASGERNALISPRADGATAWAERAAARRVSRGGAMVCLSAMQGLGGRASLRNLQWGTPIDTTFYFSGYGEGGFRATSSVPPRRFRCISACRTCPASTDRTDHPARVTAEAIMEGRRRLSARIPLDEGQFGAIRYPAAGHSKVRLFYRYGGSNSHHAGFRPLRADVQSPNLEFVVNSRSVQRRSEVRHVILLMHQLRGWT